METIKKNFDFAGRRVLVTGGARGIGKATVMAFYALNATVIALDKDEDVLAVLKEELPGVICVHVDLMNWEAVEVAVGKVQPVHHLANVAGVVGRHASLVELEEADLDPVFGVNLKAVIRVSQVVVREMIKNKVEGATIVNMSSCLSQSVMEGLLVYGATKAALDHVTRSMALELAPHGIRVNSILPTMVRTELVLGMPEERKEMYFGKALERQAYHKDFVEPETIANTVVYLSSPLSDMITGTHVRVDAGYCLG